MMTPDFPAPKLLVVLSSVAFLGGCATFSEDGGLDNVTAITSERMGVTPRPIKTEEDSARVADEVKRLLAEPLTVDSAVKIAVLNNRGLQASLSELGIAEADLVQVGRLHNPTFKYETLSGGGIRETGQQFLFDFMDLLTMSTRSEIERRRFETTQIKVASDTLRLAQATRKAWYAALAAQEAVKYMDAVNTAAQAGAKLAERMADVGNFSQLRQQREQLFHAEMTAELVRTRQKAVSERERLTRLMGLGGAQRNFKLPDRLPKLPDTLLSEPDILQQAMDNRLDVRMAKLETEGLAKSLGLTKSTRLINVLDVSYLNSQTTDEPNKSGYEIEVTLPIFDWGDARVTKAEALYTQAMHRVAEIAVNAESEVRAAYAAYRAADELARQYQDRIVPLRQQISEETLLRYNGMLIGVWELLADTRSQIAGANAAIQAKKDFWIAESNLQISLSSGGTSDVSMTASTSTAADAGGGH